MCAYWSVLSKQHALAQLLISWQKPLDKGGLVGFVLMDLTKAYDCIPHNLFLLAKLTLKLMVLIKVVSSFRTFRLSNKFYTKH